MKERKQWAEEFETIPIVTPESGSVVTLGDIARSTTASRSRASTPVQPHALGRDRQIYRIGQQSPLEISEAVRTRPRRLRATLPEGVSAVDSSAPTTTATPGSASRERRAGRVIVLAILALFLEVRLAFWVMMGMAISFVGRAVFLPMVDVSINMISMFGFLVVLGIVVDDAIVVGENIYEYRARAWDLEAAIEAPARSPAR